MKKLIGSNDHDWTGFVLRLTLGLVLFPHGAQKLLGWFGGYGFTGTMNFFTTTAGLPWIIAFAVIVIEFFGALCFITGFATRVWSVLVIMLMTGIILTSHLQNGFFMNWFGNQPGEGFEYHLLVIGLATALLIKGSGRISIDERIVAA